MQTPMVDPQRTPKLIKRWKWSGALRRLFCDNQGVSAIEYVVIICFTAAMAVIAWTMTGGNLSATFTDIANYISGSSSGPQDPDAEDSDESDESDDDDDDSDDDDDEDDSDDDEDDSDG